MVPQMLAVRTIGGYCSILVVGGEGSDFIFSMFVSSGDIWEYVIAIQKLYELDNEHGQGKELGFGGG